jgi:catechol-2,3-dioxygenase
MLFMRIHHIALRTRDVARLEAFYTGVVGLDVARRPGERAVWVEAEGVVVMIERAEPGEPEVPSGSMDLLAFAMEAHEKLALVARLERAGIAVESQTAYTLYFRDPDGRRVGVSDYRFA